MFWKSEQSQVDDEQPDEAEPGKRRPWWWRLGSFVMEMALVGALAATIPPVLSRVLHTDAPLATITSSSMWPTLKRGDLVIVRGLGDDAVAPGQIVVYRNSGDDTMIIHRVIEVDGANLVTQGDANTEPDEPISVSDVAGVVPMLGDMPLRIPFIGEIALAVNGDF